MSQKIKSITVKNLDTLSIDNGFCEILEAYPEYIEIEYEKPTLLKRPDGSLISEPEEMTEIIAITNKLRKVEFFTTIEKYKHNRCYVGIPRGSIFLPEDKNLAEKKAKMLSKQLEIQYEIDRLNAKNYKFREYILKKPDYLSYTEAFKTDFSVGQTRMSFDTAETILAKYSEDELKQYLGIII